MRCSAPVNAPFSWPNSSDSSSVSGSEPQLSRTNGPLARGLCRWICSATTSLPTPVSPRMSTVVGAAATLRTSSKTRTIASSATTTPGRFGGTGRSRTLDSAPRSALLQSAAAVTPSAGACAELIVAAGARRRSSAMRAPASPPNRQA